MNRIGMLLLPLSLFMGCSGQTVTQKEKEPVQSKSEAPDTIRKNEPEQPKSAAPETTKAMTNSCLAA